MGDLHVEPEQRTVAAQLPEADGHARRYRLFRFQNIVKRLARNAEQPGNFALRPANSRQDIVGKNPARMGGPPGKIAFCWKLTM